MRWLHKLAHKYGWHHMREVYPDGDTMLWCEWCGIRVVTKRGNYTRGLNSGQACQQAEVKRG